MKKYILLVLAIPLFLVSSVYAGWDEKNIEIQTISDALTAPQALSDSMTVALSVDHYDETTRALKTIDYAHHEIHSGNHFKAGFQDTSMAAEDAITLLLVTPDTTRWAHWTLTAQATGAVVISVYEGATASNNGTAVTIWNRNRNTAGTANTTLVYHTPTITNDGTKVVEKWVGNEGWKETIGGNARGNSEFILKQNTKYLVRLTAVSDGIKGAIGCDWYESTNKSN